MEFKIPEKSLFALLMRSPWWVSLIVAVVIFFIARLFLPDHLVPFSLITAAPFLVIAAFVAWKQLREPGTAHVAATLEAIRAMSWSDFCAALEAHFTAEGFTVKRFKGTAADLELERDGYTTLVCAKRWKAAGHGIEPLRDLEAARAKQDARIAIYVAAGEITDKARLYATEKDLRVIGGTELAQLLRKAAAQKRAA